MRHVLLDTNVLLRALAHPHGACGRLLWARRDVVLCSSRDTVAEFAEVSQRPSVRAKLPGITPEAVAAACTLLTSAHHIIDCPSVELCRDPGDDMFIACALATGADFIATYDKDLLALDGHASLCVVTPEDLLCALNSFPSDAPQDEQSTQER